MNARPFDPHAARIAAYYDGLVARYGHDPRACDYGHPASQRAKFQVLAEALALSGRRVLDVGCGFADFEGYLAQRHPGVHYEGVDVSPRMVAEARRLHPRLAIRRLDIFSEDPGGPYDLVTANGIFYLLGAEAESWMFRLVTRMYELCSEAVAFNTLSARAPDAQGDEFHADPGRVLAFCQGLTPWVTLRHDYHPRDFTVYLYRSARGAAQEA